MGILSQGLRIAPPEAPVSGYMVRSLFTICFKCSISENVGRIQLCDDAPHFFGSLAKASTLQI